ncbi:SRSF protein kinase 2 [Beauveria bassiana]|nr:SRSF protein kinase 2 [Beauveria bassiana]
MEWYTKNGFHPVDLGQILPLPETCVDQPSKEPRYRIMVKIGFGAFSTVWLARDLDEKYIFRFAFFEGEADIISRWVAVKICRGIEVPQRSSEASILSEIRETGQGKVGVEQVLRLFDDFIIKGPNGFHECLITEVVAPLTCSAVGERCSIDALRQIMEGFAFLHEQGISHGGTLPLNSLNLKSVGG